MMPAHARSCTIFGRDRRHRRKPHLALANHDGGGSGAARTAAHGAFGWGSRFPAVSPRPLCCLCAALPIRLLIPRILHAPARGPSVAPPSRSPLGAHGPPATTKAPVTASASLGSRCPQPCRCRRRRRRRRPWRRGVARLEAPPPSHGGPQPCFHHQEEYGGAAADAGAAGKDHTRAAGPARWGTPNETRRTKRGAPPPACACLRRLCRARLRHCLPPLCAERHGPEFASSALAGCYVRVRQKGVPTLKRLLAAQLQPEGLPSLRIEVRTAAKLPDIHAGFTAHARHTLAQRWLGPAAPCCPQGLSRMQGGALLSQANPFVDQEQVRPQAACTCLLTALAARQPARGRQQRAICAPTCAANPSRSTSGRGGRSCCSTGRRSRQRGRWWASS